VSDLIEALAAADRARNELQIASRRVWLAVNQAHPSVAASIKDLGLPDHAAAEWVCNENANLGTSPAGALAMGRVTDVEQLIGRIVHGLL
jgi:hypothetical protein